MKRGGEERGEEGGDGRRAEQRCDGADTTATAQPKRVIVKRRGEKRGEERWEGQEGEESCDGANSTATAQPKWLVAAGEGAVPSTENMVRA